MTSMDMGGRQEAEKAFHDRKFGEQRKKDYYYLGFTKPVFDGFLNQIGSVEDRHVLEFGCGAGWFTQMLAERGAKVWAFDVSGEAVEMARERTRRGSWKHAVHIEQMPAEQLRYDAGMFDLVVGMAILHHVDLDACLPEMRRVLKENGRAVFMEPLGHNVFLNLYRFVTPNKRSRDEAPMTMEQFRKIEGAFPRFLHREYFLLAIFGLFWHFLGFHGLMLRTRDFLSAVDEAILRAFPWAWRYCWYSILEMRRERLE